MEYEFIAKALFIIAYSTMLCAIAAIVWCLGL